ncbi:MAG: hypothetical protein Q9192_005875, partial [Flavoplaca navasiana]
LQDVEDLKQLYAGKDQTYQMSALQAYQDELEREAVTSRDRSLAILLGALPLSNKQLTEVPPVATIMPIAGAVGRPRSPDNETRDLDQTHQNDLHQSDVQQDGTCHNGIHRDINRKDSAPNDCMHQDDVHPDQMRQDAIQQPEMRTVESNHKILNELDKLSSIQRLSRSLRRADVGCEQHVADHDGIAVKLLSVSESRVSHDSTAILPESVLDHFASVEETLPSNPVEEGLEPTSESAEKCIFCDDELPPVNIIQLPCRDRYCHECIVDQFDAAMKHESLFPPKCCGCGEQVPLATVQHLLPANFEEGFKMRRLELSTPNRIYCSNNACSAFLDPWYIVRDTAACSKCFSYTCTMCQDPDHDGECHKDPDVIKTKATLAAGGYKQCPSCPYMIGLREGCNHMTYRIFVRQLPSRLLKYYKLQKESARIQITATIIIVTGLRYTTETLNARDAKQYNGSFSMSALNVSCESVRHVDKLGDGGHDDITIDEFGISPLANDRRRLGIFTQGCLSFVASFQDGR